MRKVPVLAGPDRIVVPMDIRVTPTFMTGDKSIYDKLATEAGIDLTKIGGKTLPQLKPSGFGVTVDGRTMVIPVGQ
jgi:hypothetical protein